MDYFAYQKKQQAALKKWVKEWIRSKGAKWSIIVLILAIFCSVYVGLMMNYFVVKDVWDWKYRAQTSSNAHDMKEYMIKVRDGLIKWQATEGNAYLIFKRPKADMRRITQAMDNIIKRAGELENLDMKSTEYQVGTDDLRGVIRELWIPAEVYWSRHQGLPAFLGCIILWIIFVLSLIYSICIKIKKK